MEHIITLAGYAARTADWPLMLGTVDSYGTERLLIVPGAGWDGLAITATFHAPSGKPVSVLVPENGAIDVPPEATQADGAADNGKIVFAGIADGVQRISCNMVYTLLPHAKINGSESTATPGMDAQVLAEVAKVRATLENEVDEAEKAAAQSAADAAASAEQAAQAKAGAEAAKTTAVEARAGAAASASAAKASETAAADAANRASMSEQAAALSAKNAATSEQAAETAATNAKASADAAQESAASVMGVADWNAAEGEPGHVLNRTHWVEGGMEELPVVGQWIEDDPGIWMFMVTAPVGLEVGKAYTVRWDGVEYECAAQQVVMGDDGGIYYAIGDADLLFTGTPTAGAPPFMLLEIPEGLEGVYAMAAGTDAAQHDFTISRNAGIVHKLDNEYLDLDWLPVGEWSKGDEVMAEDTRTTPMAVTGAYHFLDYTPYDLSAGSRYFVVYNGTEHLLQLTPSEDANVYGSFECDAFRAQYLYDESEGNAPYALYVYPKDGNTSVTLAIHKAVNANTLPAEFLPASVGSIILRSSTADSTKRFKITVDDSGTLTATEV